MEGNVVTAILVASGLSAALAVVLVGALGLYSSATFQAKTACTKDPAGKECAELRLEVAKAEPLRNPCASFQRVTSRRGKNCDRFFVRPGKELQANSKSVQDLDNGSEGEAGPDQSGSAALPAPGQTADSDPKQPAKSPGPRHDPQPVPVSGGGGGGGAPQQAAPGQGAPSPSPVVVVPVTPGKAEEATSRGLAPVVLEDAGAAVGVVVDKAEDVVRQTGCVVRGLLVPCP
jgi:hypothetical protein